MINVLETEWWTMVVPPEWWAESEEDTILVGDRDEVGCLEFSTLHKEEGEFDTDGVQAIAEAEAEQKVVWKPVTLGDFTGVYGAWVDEEAAIREWYVANGAMLLFITYCCDEDNGGMDDAAVDEILDTLMLVETKAD